MDRNREAFRNRFLAYKNGKSVREIYGIPEYQSGKVNYSKWDAANTQSYIIPFIKEKAITLTDAGRATGAKLSTNLLDSLADNAVRAGVPIRTAIGLATKESTLGNPTDDRTAWNLSSAIRELFDGIYPGTVQHINNGTNIVQGDNLINYHKGNINTSVFSNNTEKSVLQEGLEFYKQHPDKYNPGQPGYQKAVETRGNEVMKSPEVKRWYKEWEAKQVKVMRPKLYSLPTIQSTAPKKFGKYADGKLPGFKDGKRYIKNDDNSWTRITDDEMADQFANLVVTPNKNVEERTVYRPGQADLLTRKEIHNAGYVTDEILARDARLRYDQQLAAHHSERPLETVSPEFDLLSMGVGLLNPVKGVGNAALKKGPSLLLPAINNKGFAISTPYMGKTLGRTTVWIPTNRNPFKGISWMVTGKPVEEGLPLEYIASKYPGEGRKLYDVGINLAHKQKSKGLLVGDNLLSAPKSYSTYEHWYPNRVYVDDQGFWTNRNMVSNPRMKGRSVYSLEDFLTETKSHPDEKIMFSGAPRYRLEVPSNSRTISPQVSEYEKKLIADPLFKSTNKYRTDQNAADLFNKMRSILIRGKLAQIRPQLLDPVNDPYGIRVLADDVIHHEGMPEGVEDIFRYQILPRTNISKMNYDNTIDILSRYGYNTLDDYNWAKYVDDDLAGYLDNSTYAIALRDPYIRKAAPHEFRHRMLHLVPYKRSLAIDREAYLNKAYDEDFVNLPNVVDESDSLYGYPHMADEKATTNLDARMYVFNNFTDNPNIGKMSVVELNKFLDSLSDDLIIDAVKESNGYGKKYIKFLDDKYHIYNDLKARAKYALRFRNAMKYYGAAAIPVGFGYSTIKPRQNK